MWCGAVLVPETPSKTLTETMSNVVNRHLVSMENDICEVTNPQAHCTTINLWSLKYIAFDFDQNKIAARVDNDVKTGQNMTGNVFKLVFTMATTWLCLKF